MNNSQKKALQKGIEIAASEAARLTQAKSEMTHKAIAAMEAHTQLNAQARVTRGLAWAEFAEVEAREVASKYGNIGDGAVADYVTLRADTIIQMGLNAIDMSAQKKAREAKDIELMVTRNV